MRIAYIANARMPTEKAHGLQIMHMCRAFSQIGHEVFLVVPKRKNWIDKSIWEFYGMKPCFTLVEVPILDFIVWDRLLGNWALWLTSAWFGWRARRAIEDLKPDVIYSRDPFSSAWTPRWIPNVFEAHTFPNRALAVYRWLWRKCDRIVSVTAGLQKMFVEQGLPEARLRVAADAVDLEAFQVSASKRDLRAELGLPQDRFLVVYAGHLYPYKGIPDLIEACRGLDPKILTVIVGGRPDDLERTKAAAAKAGVANILFVGRVPHALVPKYLHASDLAVMPYTRESHHVEYYSSPLKLFEYLAAGRAIVSTDLPSVREVLDDATAEFCPPEDPKALAQALNRVAGNPARLAELEAHSTRLSKLYTWKNRAAAVLDAMPKAQDGWKVTFFKKYAVELRVTLLAFAVRAAYVAFFPQHEIEGGDSGYYLGLAERLLGIDAHDAFGPYFTPGYPLFLAIVRSAFGDSLLAVRLAQSALSATTVFVAMMIARKRVSPYAAWIAGLVMALYVPMVLESGILYTETLYAFLLTASAWFLLEAADRKGWRSALAAGVSFTFASLTREIAMYFVPVLAAWLAWTRKSAKAFLIMLIPLVIAVGGMAVRNRQAVARIPKSLPDVTAPTFAKNYDRVFLESDFRELAFSPRRWPLYAEGAYRFFRYPFRLIDVGPGVPGMKRAILDRDWATVRASWDTFAVKAFLVAFEWFLVAMAVLGLMSPRAERRFKLVASSLVFYAMITILIRTVGHARGFEAFEPLARYRFPVEPLIIILAAAGIERLTRRVPEEGEGKR